jgi:hypothetical protein
MKKHDALLMKSGARAIHPGCASRESVELMCDGREIAAPLLRRAAEERGNQEERDG